MAFQTGGSRVKVHLPVQETQGTRVRSLGQNDRLKDRAALSSTLASKIPWTEEPGRLQFLGWQRVGHDLATEHAHIKTELKKWTIILCYKY